MSGISFTYHLLEGDSDTITMDALSGIYDAFFAITKQKNPLSSVINIIEGVTLGEDLLSTEESSNPNMQIRIITENKVTPPHGTFYNTNYYYEYDPNINLVRKENPDYFDSRRIARGTSRVSITQTNPDITFSIKTTSENVSFSHSFME